MTAWERFSIPSKAFVLGEYAVLRGGQALVATLAPRFGLARGHVEGSGASARAGTTTLGELAPQSPARILIECEKSALAARYQELLAARFEDPHEGRGGFGGSTAEFALAYAAIHGTRAQVSELWSAYREIQPAASGADLAAQWTGGMVIADPVSLSAERVDAARARHLFENFFVFSAAHQPDRKVKTHEHLETLGRADLEQLARSRVLSEGLAAVKAGDFETFARSVNDYAQLLRGLGFEHPRTSEDRAVLRDVPGVCAVKGTGAMQADAVIVFGDPELRREDLLRALEPAARSRDLHLVASGWSEERGIST